MTGMEARLTNYGKCDGRKVQVEKENNENKTEYTEYIKCIHSSSVVCLNLKLHST
jgi:hypothetical protein